MPTLVTSWAQVRLRPTVGLISEEMKRSPVMFLDSISSTHLTLVSRKSRFDFPSFDTGGQDNLLGNEMRGAVPTITHV